MTRVEDDIKMTEVDVGVIRLLHFTLFRNTVDIDYRYLKTRIIRNCNEKFLRYVPLEPLFSEESRGFGILAILSSLEKST